MQNQFHIMGLHRKSNAKGTFENDIKDNINFAT